MHHKLWILPLALGFAHCALPSAGLAGFFQDLRDKWADLKQNVEDESAAARDLVTDAEDIVDPDADDS